MKKCFAAAAIALSLAGCDRPSEVQRESQGRTYSSVSECLRDNYYSETTCSAGKTVLGSAGFAPEVRAYANSRECLADGFYTVAACSKVKEMVLEMRGQNQVVLAPPLAATFPVPR